jgi:diphthine synthase
MALFLIGLGLGNIKDITLAGLELAKQASVVYLEHYTSAYGSSPQDIEAVIGKFVRLAFRQDLEQKMADLIEEARGQDVALLVVGDVFSATTHIALYLEARKAGVPVRVVFNASIMTAVGLTGLELYKFGKTTSIPFRSKGAASTPYAVIAQNKAIGLHTLCLLDLELDHPEEKRFMTIPQAIDILLAEEQTQHLGAISEQTVAIGCARLGQDDAAIKTGTLGSLAQLDFGGPLHCLIIPGTLHFVEEEALEMWR